MRKEQFNLIINCLESNCCNSQDYEEIERYVHLINHLYEEEREYNNKLNKEVEKLLK